MRCERGWYPSDRSTVVAIVRPPRVQRYLLAAPPSLFVSAPLERRGSSGIDAAGPEPGPLELRFPAGTSRPVVLRLCARPSRRVPSQTPGPQAGTRHRGGCVSPVMLRRHLWRCFANVASTLATHTHGLHPVTSGREASRCSSGTGTLRCNSASGPNSAAMLSTSTRVCHGRG